MNQATIQKQTASYDEYLFKKLKDFEFAKTYLETAFEDYMEDRDTESLSLAMREVAEAQGVGGNLEKQLDKHNLLDILSGLGFRVRLERVKVTPESVSIHQEAVEANVR